MRSPTAATSRLWPLAHSALDIPMSSRHLGATCTSVRFGARPEAGDAVRRPPRRTAPCSYDAWPDSTTSTPKTYASVARVLPGAGQTLAALAELPDFIQTVLTGNLRAVAETKLRVFDLDRFIDVEIGAYGDDESDRPKLVAVAQRAPSTA